MAKLWLVTCYEFKRYALRKSFIVTLLSVPVLILFIFGLVWLLSAKERSKAPIGYVDHPGFIKESTAVPKRAGSPNDPGTADLLPLIQFNTEEEARQSLESGEIQAYFVIAPDYLESNKVELVYFKAPPRHVRNQFWDLMQMNIIRELPHDAAQRAVAGNNLIIRWPDDSPGGAREFSERTFLSNLLPLFTGIGFVMLLFMSSGYMMGAVIEEKENRTVELMVTSLSPTQLIGGKILGTVALSLTHLLVWLAFALLLIFVAGHYFDIQALRTLTINLYILTVMFAIALPTYIMVAAAMTAVGAMVNEFQEAQQMSFFFVLPFMITMWLAKPILDNADGPLALGLSFFPLTALPAYIFRITFIPIPLWQIATTVAILSLSALAAMWIAGRAFRLGMLRYGKRLNLAELFGRAQHE